MDVLALLAQRDIKYQHKGGGEYAIICPAQHLHAGGRDDNPSFLINIEKLLGHCFACGHRMNEAGLYRWLVGGELDDLHLRSLEINGALKRITDQEERPCEDSQELFFPTGEPWAIDGYRGISLAAYRELGAVKVTRGRYQNRICFPIYVNGILKGVDARTLGDDQPKYLRNKDSSCKTDWLFPFDKVKEQKPRLVILGEGLFHAINAFDKGIPGLCFFGANNWSDNKTIMLLSIGAREVCYFPDPDRAGYQAGEKICSALYPWFKVTVADVSPYIADNRDLGDLTRKEMIWSINRRGKPVLPKCLLNDWGYKIEYGRECKEWGCRHNKRSTCNHLLYQKGV